LTSFLVFVVIAIISALIQPSPPDIPVVQFGTEPIKVSILINKYILKNSASG
jgi:hypothetical protein